MSPGEPDVAIASAIDMLGQLGVLPDTLARRFRGIAGFRNVLVHGYLAVDPGRLHELLNSGLDDFVAFAQHVERYLTACSAHLILAAARTPDGVTIARG